MLITMDRASSVLVDYLSVELDKISDPVKRFGYKFAVGAMSANPSVIAQKARMLGVLSDGGMLDTDAVRNGLHAAFTGGNSFSVLGLTFSAADGDELIRRMEM